MTERLRPGIVLHTPEEDCTVVVDDRAADDADVELEQVAASFTRHDLWARLA